MGSDKKVLVGAWEQQTEALPPILCSCQGIKHQVPQGSPGLRCASETTEQEVAGAQLSRTATVYLFNILGLKIRFYLKERVSV